MARGGLLKLTGLPLRALAGRSHQHIRQYPTKVQLIDVGKGTGSERRLLIGAVGVLPDHHHRHRGTKLCEALRQHQPARVRQIDIGEHNVGREVLCTRECFPGCSDSPDDRARDVCQHQIPREICAIRCIPINNQDSNTQLLPQSASFCHIVRIHVRFIARPGL